MNASISLSSFSLQKDQFEFIKRYDDMGERKKNLNVF